MTLTRPRDVQVAEIAPQTSVWRSRTWERLKFEVEYARQRGTTANSYLITADQTALIDPPGASFTDLFLAELCQSIDLACLDYLVLGHVNANRLSTLEALLLQAPQVVILCSRPAANTLKAVHPEWESRIQVVRSGDRCDLGQGHELQFLRVPTPRWPDGLWSFDKATQILYSDKFFGVHVCEDALYDDNWKALDGDRRYYFDCLHAPQAKQVETVLEALPSLGAKLYAPGHGPIVRYSLSRFSFDYRQWCQQQRSQDLNVVLLYASAYGNTATVAGAIAQGLVDAGVTVEAINCEFAEPAEISRALDACDGFIIGSPTLGGHAPTQIQTALGLILATATKGKLAGVFGSYGWSGEAIDLLESKLRDANFRFGFAPLRVRFSPTEADLSAGQAVGAAFVQALRDSKRSRSPRQGVPEAQVDRTDQAVGRIVGSLCVVTTLNGQQHRGILTSWVSQASFSPPGLMIAVAEDQNAELMQYAGAQFVLNILKEGRNVRRYFARHGSQGEVPFASLTTQIAHNGCLILDEALAYLECTTQRAMKCGDRWLIYAAVEQGQVLADEGLTAIEHRKSGSQD